MSRDVRAPNLSELFAKAPVVINRAVSFYLGKHLQRPAAHHRQRQPAPWLADNRNIGLVLANPKSGPLA